MRLALPVTIESGLHFDIPFPEQTVIETHILDGEAQPAVSAAPDALGSMPEREARAENTLPEPDAGAQTSGHNIDPAPDATAKVLRIPWQSVVMGVWLAGFAAVAGVTIVSKTKV